jgi:hypothetical protein
MSDLRPLSKTTVGAIGETNPLSPWANKLILCLGTDIHKGAIAVRATDIHSDGGGVKGYSSLLILKRLVCLIEEFEKGVRPLSTGVSAVAS